MYCECFKHGSACSAGCKCLDCHNVIDGLRWKSKKATSSALSDRNTSLPASERCVAEQANERSFNGVAVSAQVGDSHPWCSGGLSARCARKICHVSTTVAQLARRPTPSLLVHSNSSHGLHKSGSDARRVRYVLHKAYGFCTDATAL
jgi:hypothetical protein